VSAFDAQPAGGSSVLASFAGSDQGGSFITVAELWRASFNGAGCSESVRTGCSWARTQSKPAPPSSTVWSSTFTESPVPGTYWYGVHLVDGAGNFGVEPAPLKVVVGSAAGPPAATPLSRGDWIAWATQSAPADPPAHALDGLLHTRFSTGAAQHDSQGFRVSWPGNRRIGRVRIETGPSPGDYPRACGIWLTAAGGSVSTYIACMPDAAGVVDISFPPVDTQKIEVWQWGTALNWWSIAELNAYP
jgi:hypothetical protein